MEIFTQILNPAVGLYLLILLGIQILISIIRHQRQKQIDRKRARQGLTGPVLMNHAERLRERRWAALLESSILILSVIIIPFLIVRFACYIPLIKESPEPEKGLGLVFGSLILWLLFTGTDIAKAFLGGLMFKTLAAFKQPFQIGDRVTLRGISGKVTQLDTFFVQLQTPNDDLISIPTSSLWTEVLSSTNGGDRASLCVINFYLASFVTAQQRQDVEDIIWNAIQSSVYYEPAKPMQIYLSQTPEAIQLTAKAYVASTYNEPLFVSDVTRAVLDFTAKAGIVLAPATWEVQPTAKMIASPSSGD